MSDKKSVTVTIYGNEYTMKGEADPQYIAELAKFVDSKMTEIGRKSSAPAAKVAILASMNIADELHRLERSKTDNLKLIETLEKSLLEMKKSADGSLKHTLELKEQVDKYKAETAENKKKLEDASAELARTRGNLETAGKEKGEVEKVKKELETARQRSSELSQEVEKLKGELESMKPRLDEMKDDMDAAEGLNDEAQAEIKDLRDKVAHLSAELDKAKRAPAAQLAASNFLPDDAKLQALFKKIDAILE